MDQNNEQKQIAAKSSFMVEDLISMALRVGVIISSLITSCGLVLFLVTGYSGYPVGTFPTSITQVLAGLIQFKPFAIIELGLLILLATPIFWVAASIVVFLFHRDYIYMFIATYVLLMLLLGLFLGKAE